MLRSARWSVSMVALLLTTCGASHAAPRAAVTVALPPQHAAFSYQLGGTFVPAHPVGVVDRDRGEKPLPGAYGICYVNAFQAQPEALGWWRAHHADLLLLRGGREVIDRGWNERLLNTSTPRRRQALAAIVGRWIDGCAASGYRAVEPDNLDSWTRSRGGLTPGDNLAFAALLIARAHARGLAIAQKNTPEIAAPGRRLGFDFAVAEECQVYRECRVYQRAYGNEVIEIEYTDAGGAENFAAACVARGAAISLVLRDRDVLPDGHPGFVERSCPKR